MGYLEGNDRIYRIKFLPNGNVEGELLHKGNLNFSKKNPIETLNFYESESIQKIYWIDGNNQLRFFNKNSSTFENWNDNTFDCIPELDLKESVEISSDSTVGGIFAAGTIQYAFTYYNLYGQQSNIFYISSLYNVALNTRAGAPDEVISNSFKIKISNLDRKYDYVRIYSIQTTSLNNVSVSIVGDYSIPKNDNDDKVFNIIEIVDSGLYKETVSESSLLYIRGEKLIPNAIAQKDGTLFLANYKLSNSAIGNLQIQKKNSSVSIDLYKLLFKGNDGLTSPGYDSKATSFIELSSKEMMADLTHNKYYSYTPDSLMNKKTTGTNIGDFESFKTFKTNEVYRMGVQFQHNSGVWSEPLFINDKTIDLLNFTEPIYWNESDISFVRYCGVKAKIKLHDTEWHLIKTLTDNGFIKARPVVVYPNVYERKVIAQGVVNPSMYFCDDRISKNINNVSSWFFRPMVHKRKNPNSNFTPRLYNWITGGDTFTDYSGRTTKFGTFAEWRHNFALPSARCYDSTNINNVNKWVLTLTNIGSTAILNRGYINQEIQSLHHNYLMNAYCTQGWKTSAGIVPSSNIMSFVNGNFVRIQSITPEQFERFYPNEPFIDQNIITFHSPDIEYDTYFNNINKEDLEIRVVGYVNITSFLSDKFNTISTGQIDPKAPGFIEKGYNKLNTNTDIDINNILFENITTTPGSNMVISTPIYRDKKFINANDPTLEDYTTFPIYPWHAMGSTLGYDVTSLALLEYNKTANLRYSSFTTYLTNATTINGYRKAAPRVLSTMTSSNIKTVVDISKIELYDYENNELVKLNFAHEKMQNIFYQGNVNKVVNSSPALYPDGYPLLQSEAFSLTSDNNIAEYNKYDRYYIQAYNNVTSSRVYKRTPVRIKFNTTPHLVFGLEPINYGEYISQPILPSVNNHYNLNGNYGQPFWDNQMWYTSQNNIEVKHPNNISNEFVETDFGGLWLVEIWRKDSALKHRFGDMVNEYGNNIPTQESLEKLSWVPCGEPVSLLESNNFPKTFVEIEYTEGDTYLQRYDCLKTYGQPTEKQSITEILSFVCESRIASDGRYDKLRGIPKITYATKENFNTINPVYSQKNNYFTYSSLNYNKSYIKDFPNSILWTTAKISGALIDTWTNINLFSSTESDGNLGPITSIVNHNNKLIGFQPKGIFEILFNSRVQIPTSDNNPIQITSNYKLESLNYIVKNVGSLNKWSINNDSPGEIYFIDDINRSLFSLSKFENITLNKGFYTWGNENLNKLLPWNMQTFDNFKLFYNSILKDVYLVDKTTCLAYSQFSDQFTSFYEYYNTPFMFNISNKFITISKDRSLTNNKFYLWENNIGDYNKFFNKNYGYHIEYNVNTEPTVSKIFDSLEFRADSYVDNILFKNPLFDKISVKNENQYGEYTLLTPTLYSNKNLIGRYKVWRTFIPRDSIVINSPSVLSGYNYNKNRMMGTNLYLKLSSEGITNHKTILKDITVFMRR